MRWPRGTRDLPPDVAAQADAADGLRLDLELVAACCRLAAAQRAGEPEPLRRAQVEVGEAHKRRHKLEREALAPSPIRALADEHRLSAQERALLLFAIAPALSREVSDLYGRLGGAGPRLFAELLGGIGGALSPEATLVRAGLVTADGRPGPVGRRVTAPTADEAARVV